MPKSQPDQFRAAEEQRKTSACYIYIIEHAGSLFHLAGYNEDVVVDGLPPTKGTDPQVFTRAQIQHTAVEQKSEIGANQIDLVLGINDSAYAALLREMVLYTTPHTITITIIRVNSASLPSSITWGTDTYVIFKGIATNLAFSAGAINVTLLSLIMQAGGKIPRYFRQKTCQHMLGETLCGVNLDDPAFRLITTLDAVSLRGRYVEISEVTLDGNPITAETFQAGKLIETDFDDNTITILATELLPAGAGVRLFLGWWSKTLAAAENVKVVRGCNRTLTQCDTVFNNKDNFGGQPWIPTTSPAVHGL